jgi:hypothetical protein
LANQSWDSADRAAVDMRFRKRAGAVALLERWALVAPLDFFEEQVVFTDSPRDSIDGGADVRASPDNSRRQSHLRHSVNPDDADNHDDGDDDDDGNDNDLVVDDAHAMYIDDDDDDSSSSTNNDTPRTPPPAASSGNDGEDEGVLTSPTKHLSHRWSSGRRSLRRSIGSMRQLRPQVVAFFRTEHGRFARRVAAIESQLLSALEPLSIESREIVEISSVIDEGVTAPVSSIKATVGNLWGPGRAAV